MKVSKKFRRTVPAGVSAKAWARHLIREEDDTDYAELAAQWLMNKGCNL